MVTMDRYVHLGMLHQDAVMFSAVGFSVSYGQPLVEQRLKAFKLRSTLTRPAWGSRWIRFG